jgi:hypothetical protein
MHLRKNHEQPFFFLSALTLWKNSVLTNLQSPLHVEFHVLHGPRPQDARACYVPPDAILKVTDKSIFRTNPVGLDGD